MVMTQVDRITEDIAHMPVAAFIFRDKESDEVHYSTNIRNPVTARPSEVLRALGRSSLRLLFT